MEHLVFYEVILTFGALEFSFYDLYLRFPSMESHHLLERAKKGYPNL